MFLGVVCFWALISNSSGTCSFSYHSDRKLTKQMIVVVLKFQLLHIAKSSLWILISLNGQLFVTVARAIGSVGNKSIIHLPSLS